MTRHVWVIEMQCDKGTLWHATATEERLSSARIELAAWRNNNPDDHFRLVKYVPAKP